MARPRDCIHILDRKTSLPSWMIVCNIDPGPADETGLPIYSHHWTGWSWEPRGGDEFHVYTSRETAESYARHQSLRMRLTFPGTWTGKLLGWWNRRPADPEE
ncbi:hypothetical protein Pan44_52890 [Caulifigura coniformis]|uniref:Uncharacterized protein n=1 Tax=Caulifigura coniformis TaxID=2527983 RepID=A0A517SM78_9PLAN|nr:hypothetical protein [Caulifigura coniformis]QDT57222.1 hypothetical protein Pan44_52890 [Caulifigura coniformis]